LASECNEEANNEMGGEATPVERPPNNNSRRAFTPNGCGIIHLAFLTPFTKGLRRYVPVGDWPLEEHPKSAALTVE
jgi:hypothetical protein